MSPRTKERHVAVPAVAMGTGTVIMAMAMVGVGAGAAMVQDWVQSTLKARRVSWWSWEC